MRQFAVSLAALLVAAAFVSPAAAAPPDCCCCMPHPVGPDACGPGCYYYNCYGGVYGPNYCLVPACPPFNGMLPAPKPPQQGPQIGGQFPSHPYARSPRDYFMYEDLGRGEAQ